MTGAEEGPMHCPTCQTPLPPGSARCGDCGHLLELPTPADGPGSRILPARNRPALLGYYCGVFALIPLLGLTLGPLALVYGVQGLQRVLARPQVQGAGHAVAAITLGALTTLFNLALLLLTAAGLLVRRFAG